MTEVVNQKHTNDYDVDIGRSNNGNSHMNNTPVGEPGWIGNPYTLKKYGGNYTRQESIDAFREAFHDRLEEDSEFREAVDELQGRVLGCYCKPDPCHGDVIVEYLDTESILDYV